MNLHGQINAACESRPGHPQPCHWSVWIVLECGFHVKLRIKWISVLAGLFRVLANPVTFVMHSTHIFWIERHLPFL